MKLRVLVVEDEQANSEPLAEHLVREGFDQEVAGTLEAARTSFDRTAPEVTHLDVMLPDGDGRDLCREIRKSSDVPIVMLTARGEEVDRIVGLELGQTTAWSSRSAPASWLPAPARSCGEASRVQARARWKWAPRRSTRPPEPSRRTANPWSSPLRSSTCCTC
jgi:CheY-like chemotaxis protein